MCCPTSVVGGTEPRETASESLPLTWTVSLSRALPGQQQKNRPFASFLLDPQELTCGTTRACRVYILFLRFVRRLFFGHELRRSCFGGKATRKEDEAEGGQGRDRALRQRQQGRFKASDFQLAISCSCNWPCLPTFYFSVGEGPSVYAWVWCSRA